MSLVDIVGEWLSFTFIAIALGLDGFSVCLAIGMYKLRLRRIVFIGILIGIFHMLLPFIGLIIGHVLSEKWTNVAATSGSFLLISIGFYMIFSSWQNDARTIYPYGIRLITVLFFISVDSFPVGISLGLSGVKTALFIFLFGFITAFLGWIGLLIGKKTSDWFGLYSEMVGGVILSLFGLMKLFIYPA